MDRLYFKIALAATDLAMKANYLAMNANYREDIDQATRPFIPSIYEAVNNAVEVLDLALMRQRITDLDLRDDLTNR